MKNLLSTCIAVLFLSMAYSSTAVAQESPKKRANY